MKAKITNVLSGEHYLVEDENGCKCEADRIVYHTLVHRVISYGNCCVKGWVCAERVKEAK